MAAVPVSFKLYPDTVEQFRAWCKENRFTADQGFRLLLSRMGGGIGELTERQT
jgi:hypothetical protein